MKFISGLKTVLLATVLAVTFSGCETLIEDEKLRVSPNSPSPDQIDPNFLLNSIQTALPGFFNAAQTPAAALSRMRYMSGNTYENAYQAQSFNGLWSTGYATILNDCNALIPVAVERRLYTHAAIAYIVRAYVYTTLTDVFGKIPYADALKGDQGADFFNPQASEGSVVYAGSIEDLDRAISLLDSVQIASPTNDLYFGASTAFYNAPTAARTAADEQWYRLANTLKLKLAVTAMKADPAKYSAIRDTLLTANYATGSAFTARLLYSNTSTASGSNIAARTQSNFAFRYSTNSANPDSRHPYFIDSYLNGAQTYMSNNYMNMVINDKTAADPRLRYYFYRQTATPTTNVNELDCINRTAPSHYVAHYSNTAINKYGLPVAWCQLPDGYWGRDHGNFDGIPPDNFLRTAFGVYPGGGAFDEDDPGRVDPTSGLQGAGIHPIWMHFYTNFLLAEAFLDAGNLASARSELNTGMFNSIEYVISFGSAAVGEATALVPSTGSRTAYRNEVLARWDAATTDEERREIIIREYFLALWGNGLEAYNNYRRTTYPRDLQPHQEPGPGKFYRSFTYPASYIQLNSNAEPQKADNSVKVFWDNNTSYNFDF